MISESVSRTVTSSHNELDRPSLSSQAFEPFTRSLFCEAGLKPGMRVLDFCSGAGDVAFLARDIVGSEGQVIGVDETEATVAYAGERADFRELDNVSFVKASVEALPFGQDFDAIVGRIALMYRSDPAQNVRALIRHLKPGGLMVFQELDMLTGKTVPPAPVIDQVRKWILETFARAGIEVEMGSKLYSIFKAAGLDEPEMRSDCFIGGPKSLGPALMTNVVSILLPQITDLGIASAEAVQLETLEERIRADLSQSGSVMSLPLLIGTWARLPD